MLTVACDAYIAMGNTVIRPGDILLGGLVDTSRDEDKAVEDRARALRDEDLRKLAAK